MIYYLNALFERTAMHCHLRNVLDAQDVFWKFLKQCICLFLSFASLLACHFVRLFIVLLVNLFHRLFIRTLVPLVVCFSVSQSVSQSVVISHYFLYPIFLHCQPSLATNTTNNPRWRHYLLLIGDTTTRVTTRWCHMYLLYHVT